MRPLIATAATTPSSSASNLEAEDQNWLEQDGQQRRKGLVWKAFLLGSVFGFVLQGAAAFDTFYYILKIWGQSITSAALFFIWWTTSTALFFIWLTLCLRKQLDEGVGAPAGSNSIWRARMSVLMSVSFLFGDIAGSCLFLVGVCVPMGMYVPWTRLLIAVVVVFVLFWLGIKCIDWRHNKSGAEQEDEEDDSFFV